MKVVHVIPLSKGIFKETLSYFSSRDVPVGSIVEIEVRKRKAYALVADIEDAAAVKSRLRASSFTMKKLGDVASKRFFLPAFVKAAQETARYFATTTGEVLKTLTPKVIVAECFKMEVGNPEKEASTPAKLPSEAFVLQMDDSERLTTYKSIIREEFARGSSVFFCLPTVLDVETILDTLERGIKEYTFILHGDLSKKELLAVWKRIVSEPHPVLIIATGSFFSIPRPDISTIILDKESSRNYKTFARPYFDIRTFAEILARHARVKLILGDMILRPETIWRTHKSEFLELHPLKFRSLSTADQQIVDMREYKKDGAKKTFSLLSDEIKQLITDSKERNEHLFILAGRRGLSPVTVCNDCGALVQCERCHTPVVLHKKGGARSAENVFLCHKCGDQKDALRRCDTCNSWRLAALGIGIESIEQEIENISPTSKIFRIDGDTVKTHKKGMEIAENFFSLPGGILLGTEMALPYLKKEVDNGAALGIDSLFTIPDFRMNERIFSLLLQLRAKTQKRFLIQTRNPEERVFEYAIKGNILDFYRHEIHQRKEFRYPPFSVLIKITHQGKPRDAEKEMERLAAILGKYSPHLYPSFAPVARGTHAINALLRIERNEWVDEGLLEILRALPPSFTIKIDPEDLL